MSARSTTLRDEFAMAALEAVVSQRNDRKSLPNPGNQKDYDKWKQQCYEEDAEIAYGYADAMIKVRKKKG